MTTPAVPDGFDIEGRRTQTFPTLPAAVIARVRASGVERTFEDGAIVFARGQSGAPFDIVLEGQLEVVHPSRSGEQPIVVHEPGQFTGELSMVAGRPTLVTGRAKGPLRVLEIAHEQFLSLLQTDSELSEIVMRAFILRRMGLFQSGYGDVTVVGSSHSAATRRVQDFLTRNGHPYDYVDVERDADVESLLGHLRIAPDEIPIVICANGSTLRNPTNAAIADCLGFNATIVDGAVHDVVVVGAGVGGLAAAVYAGSEGLDVLVVEATAPGGQASTSSKIENYLGFPTGISGQSLAHRALNQAEKFGAKLAIAHGAVKLHCGGRGEMTIDLEGGRTVRARAVIIASGAEYRKLEIADLARFEGVGVYYAATYMEAQRCASDEVILVGGANSAGQAATFLSKTSRHVHVLIRGADLSSTMSRYLIRRIEETPNITVQRRTQVTALHGGERLERVTWRDDASGEETTHAIGHVFSMTGARPNTAWLGDCLALDANGFVCTDSELTDDLLAKHEWPLARRPYLFETSRPRIFAVGDVRATSVKRVASAVGEGSVCIQLVHKALAEPS
jgi:thioredoxin reductase (NADPH)